MLCIEYYSIPHSLSAELAVGNKRSFQQKVWNSGFFISAKILLFYLQTPISLGNKILNPLLFFIICMRKGRQKKNYPILFLIVMLLLNAYSNIQIAVAFCMGLPFLIFIRLNIMTLLPLCSLPTSKVIFVEEKCSMSASISSSSSKL